MTKNPTFEGINLISQLKIAYRENSNQDPFYGSAIPGDIVIV